MNESTLIAAIAPVIVILALGFAARKHHSFDADQASGMSELALKFALPASLFLGMAQLPRDELLQQLPIVGVMVIGYSVLYLVLYAVLRLLHMSNLDAALLGYAFSSTAVPIFGLTVFTPLYNEQTATEVVGMVALVTNITQVAVAVFLLQRAAADGDDKPSVVKTLGHSLVNPLVWAPVLGAILALLGVPLSSYINDALEPLATSASAVAIFASGLILAAQHIKLTSRVVIAGVAISLIAQPALFYLMFTLFGITGSTAQAVFVASSMPASTPSVLFAQQYKTRQAETATILLVTTVGMLVTIPVTVWISGSL